MELPKTFDPKGMDQRWYDRWMEKKLFASIPDGREPYTIVIPPPNVTGVLHMGHALNNTIQDVLIRRARMQGKNACWVPGTDHASIATEAKVVQMLRERGIKKSDLSREEFLKYAWEWKEKYGGIIFQQLKKLGCSCDWDRTTFTMDDDYYRSVIRVFVDLYQKGYIYRGLRMINWDPKAKTALSDEEVFYKEVKSKLYFVRYHLDSDNHQSKRSEDPDISSGLTIGNSITIATVRPETILGDSAIAVNPNDERYKHLIGKFAFVPLINRRIPIIADEYVTVEFGTGALKITPAHDMNDYQIGLKHKLEVVDVLNEDGTMSEAAQRYIGQDRFECRKNILKDLEEQGHVVKIEDYVNQIGYSERTDAVIEPRLSMQWWVKMSEMSKPSLKAVMDEEIKFYPKKFVNLYRHWMENIKDWCISRQLWWGHRIPAYYLPDGRFVVAETPDEAYQKAISDFGLSISELKKEDLRQDEDVMDTWFSSWLWPFEVFHGLSKPGNDEIKYYYPTTTLVTAPEIIFFWVARMIMAGFEYMHEKPFRNLYFTGIVRDKQGRKMSKSLGNSPDLLELIDKYGADAVRFGILISSPAGNDLLFDEKLIEQGRNFNNKIWNALRLIRSWEDNLTTDKDSFLKNSFAVQWFENKLNQTLVEIEKFYNQFEISQALSTIFSLIWDDFCSWYLDMIKPEYGGQVNREIYYITLNFFERLLKVLHPFMPFITEELYHLMKQRGEEDFIILSNDESKLIVQKLILQEGEWVKSIVTQIRAYKNRNQIKANEMLELEVLVKGDEQNKDVKSQASYILGFGRWINEGVNSIKLLIRKIWSRNRAIQDIVAEVKKTSESADLNSPSNRLSDEGWELLVKLAALKEVRKVSLLGGKSFAQVDGTQLYLKTDKPINEEQETRLAFEESERKSKLRAKSIEKTRELSIAKQEGKKIPSQLSQNEKKKIIDSEERLFSLNKQLAKTNASRETISFLLGSGFSIYEKIPGTQDLNRMFSELTPEQFSVTPDMRAFFLNGQYDPNRWMHNDEIEFVTEFINFYIKNIVGSPDKFHYEYFYDYLFEYYKDSERKRKIEEFCDEFNRKHYPNKESPRDCINRIQDLTRSFSQLVAQKLFKRQYVESISPMNYPPYDGFIQFLVKLAMNSEVKVHSLNHDMFFDWLGRFHADLWQLFGDGFQLAGSPYYGIVSRDFEYIENEEKIKIRKSYYVKLAQFANIYDKPISFYKLHGSISNVIVFSPEENGEKAVRLRSDYGVHEYYKEIKMENDRYDFKFLWDEVTPDFLSGSTKKINWYSGDNYYKLLFEHFQNNLSNSKVLFVIGYGFQDEGVNEYIEKNYLSRGGKLVIVDPTLPSSKLVEKFHSIGQIIHIPRGVEEVSLSDYIDLLPEETQNLLNDKNEKPSGRFSSPLSEILKERTKK